jgi:phosphopantothenoylcysteine decarboxylase/phosphopantothenate--cysteine ligase
MGSTDSTMGRLPDPSRTDRGRSMKGRRILLGVSGGIAAYKAALLARRLVGAGAVVDVVLTRGAREFIGVATFEGITGRAVRSEVWEDIAEGTHVALGREADAIVVYPATAHTVARLAAGLADDLLTTAVLAHRGPVVVAPAMHTEMWTHPATEHNVATLVERGVHVVGPASGALMGGDEGLGRLVEPDEVMVELAAALGGAATHEARPTEGDLRDLQVVVTAAGTREPLDPVRFLGNRSSGRMGFALAEAARDRGAKVTLIAAPSALPTPHGVARVDVGTARELEAAVRKVEGDADLVLMAAAVADFRPREVSDEKLRRGDGVPVVELEANPDILAGIVERRGDDVRPVIVGFAAQTGDLDDAAAKKLAAKGCELLVANDVSLPGIGFDGPDNAVLILHRDGRRRSVPRAGKRSVAEAILDEVAPLLG